MSIFSSLFKGENSIKAINKSKYLLKLFNVISNVYIEFFSGLGKDIFSTKKIATIKIIINNNNFIIKNNDLPKLAVYCISVAYFTINLNLKIRHNYENQIQNRIIN